MTIVEALKEARKALLQVEMVGHTVDGARDGMAFVEACAWCHGEDHADDCQREIALAAIGQALGPF